MRLLEDPKELQLPSWFYRQISLMKLKYQILLPSVSQQLSS